MVDEIFSSHMLALRRKFHILTSTALQSEGCLKFGLGSCIRDICTVGGSIMDSGASQASPREQSTQSLTQSGRSTASRRSATSSGPPVLETNAAVNEAAALENLERYVDSLEGESLRYHPIIVTESSVDRWPAGTVPGRLLVTHVAIGLVPSRSSSATQISLPQNQNCKKTCTQRLQNLACS